MESPWRDPLFTPGDRFPLGPPPEFWTAQHEQPSDGGARPYSLRHAVPVGQDDGGSEVRYGYDPVRQIGMVHGPGGEDIPLLKHTKPGPTQGDTSGYTDGDPKNPPPEEMTPDYQSD